MPSPRPAPKPAASTPSRRSALVPPPLLREPFVEQAPKLPQLLLAHAPVAHELREQELLGSLEDLVEHAGERTLARRFLRDARHVAMRFALADMLDESL